MLGFEDGAQSLWPFQPYTESSRAAEGGRRDHVMCGAQEGNMVNHMQGKQLHSSTLSLASILLIFNYF